MRTLNKVTDNTFKHIIESKDPCLVVFTADWCQPCHKFKTILKDLESDIPVFMADLEDNLESIDQYKIMGVPTTLFFEEGKVKDLVIGMMDEKQLNAFICLNT